MNVLHTHEAPAFRGGTRGPIARPADSNTRRQCF
jgi:hypothetical protein